MTSTRYAELEGVLAAKRAEIKSGLDNGVKIDGNNIEIKSADYQALQSRMREIEEIKSLMVMEALPTSGAAIFDADPNMTLRRRLSPSAVQRFSEESRPMRPPCR